MSIQDFKVNSIILVIIVLSVFIILFYLKSRGKDRTSQNYLYGIILFLVVYILSRFGEIFRIFVSSEFLWYMENLVGIISIMLLIFIVELYVLEKKSKFILTLIQLIFLILAIIFRYFDVPFMGLTLGTWALYGSSAPALFIPAVYFFFAGKTSGETRKKALWAGIGFILFFLGIVIKTQFGEALFGLVMVDFAAYFTHIIYVICVSVGMTIYYISIKF